MLQIFLKENTYCKNFRVQVSGGISHFCPCTGAFCHSSPIPVSTSSAGTAATGICTGWKSSYSLFWGQICKISLHPASPGLLWDVGQVNPPLSTCHPLIMSLCSCPQCHCCTSGAGGARGHFWPKAAPSPWAFSLPSPHSPLGLFTLGHGDK